MITINKKIDNEQPHPTTFTQSKWKINKSCYLLGLILLLVLVNFGLTFAATNYLTVSFVAQASVEQLAQYTIFSNLIANYSPVLLPINFLILWCSVGLTIKRCRELKLNNLVMLVLALVNFLFFNSLLNSVSLFAYGFDLYQFSVTYLIEPNTVLNFAAAIIVFGIMSNAFLLFASSSTEDKWLAFQNEEKGKGEQEATYGMGQFAYTYFIGRLMLINFIVAVFVAAMAYFSYELFARLIDSGIFIVALLVFNFVISILYVYALVQRIKNSGISFLYLIAGFSFLLLVVAFIAYTLIGTSSPSLLAVASFPFLVMLIATMQVLPFLLKSK